MNLVLDFKPQETVTNQRLKFFEFFLQKFVNQILSITEQNGYLILYDRTKRKLLHCCKETEAFFNIPEDELITKDISFIKRFVSHESLSKVKKLLYSEEFDSPTSFTIYARGHNSCCYDKYMCNTKRIFNGNIIVLQVFNINPLNNMNIDMDQMFSSMEPSDMYKKYSEELTDRELQIMELSFIGLSNKSIADSLYISPLTVKTHKQNINKKLRSQATL